MSNLTEVAVGGATAKSREWKNGDLAQCKQIGDYFNCVGVMKAIIHVHWTHSLDVEIAGERIILATRHWWKVPQSLTANVEEGIPAPAKPHDGPADDTERVSEDLDENSADSSSDSSENSM